MTITMEHVFKHYRGIRAVDDVSFQVLPGSITALLGPNGAGKTTTLRILLGLTRPTSGEARVNGVRYVDLARPRAVVGSQLDGAGAHPGRTVGGHLQALADTTGQSADAVGRALAGVQLDHVVRRRVRALSLGMRQRLGIAAALLADPPHLVLDEPGNGMDPEGVVWLRRLLRQRADDGCAVLLSSHQLGEVMAIADRVVVIAAGRLMVDAPLSTLGASPEELEHAYLRMVDR